MSKLGAAIYLHLMNSEHEIADYVNLLAKNKFAFIFTTLINFKNTDIKNWKLLAALTKAANENKLIAFADVNSILFDELNLTNKKAKAIIKYFQNLGLHGIRFDENIDIRLQAKISKNNKNFLVMINANANMRFLEKMVKYNRLNCDNTICCFNFYPQRYTAASIEFFLLNQYLGYEYNINSAAFVSLLGDKYQGPWPYNDGLPSLEIHRDWPIAEQISHLVALGTDFIIIANQFLTSADFSNLQNINLEILNLKINIVKYLTNDELAALNEQTVHIVRSDISQDVIRSKNSIINNANLKINAQEQQTVYWEPGDILLLNHKAKNYQGELQVVTKKIKNDGIRNLIAKVDAKYVLYFLAQLKADRPFKLQIVNNDNKLAINFCK